MASAETAATDANIECLIVDALLVVCLALEFRMVPTSFAVKVLSAMQFPVIVCIFPWSVAEYYVGLIAQRLFVFPCSYPSVEWSIRGVLYPSIPSRPQTHCRRGVRLFYSLPHVQGHTKLKMRGVIIAIKYSH
jgi:hypothetical protein